MLKVKHVWLTSEILAIKLKLLSQNEQFVVNLNVVCAQTLTIQLQQSLCYLGGECLKSK